MITKITSQEKSVIGDAPGFVSHLRGLSTDTMPTDVRNGDTFYCIDTQELYMFNGATSTWVKQ